MPGTDLHTFALLASDIAPSIERIDGLLFLDRENVGADALRAKIRTFATPKEAQSWMNLVPIDDFIDCAVDGWSMSDDALTGLIDTYRRAWMSIVQARFGAVEGVSVECLLDDEYGDVVLRLTQTE